MAIVTESKLPPVSGVPFWRHTPVTHTDFKPTAGPTKTLTLPIPIPVRAAVTGALIHHTAAFVGGTTSAATLTIGDGGSIVRYSPARDVFQSPGEFLTFENTDFGGTSDTALFVLSTDTPDDLTATLTITGDIIDNLTAGAADIWILFAQAPIP